jgi:methyl-accepting chemotaxis protein
MNKLSRFFNSIETKIQISLLTLSAISIIISVFVYYYLNGKVTVDVSKFLLEHIWLQIGISIFFNIILGIFVYRAIAKPVRILCEVMRDLTNGDMDAEIPYVSQPDEIGSLARKVLIFKEHMLKLREMELTAINNRIESEKAKKNEFVSKIAHEFDSKVKSISERLLKTAQELKNSSGSLASSTDNSRKAIADLMSATRKATDNVNSVASASEEMSSSIAEISSQTERSTEIAQNASSKAKGASNTIYELSVGAEKIGSVIEMINDIAEQINLLALNATIEAARAGESGKGFAVVASEVKNLATQTSSATKEISSLIGSIQEQTNGAVEAIADVNNIISEINTITKNIADAIQEQHVATQEITRNMMEAAGHSNNVSSNAKLSSSSFEDVNVASNNIVFSSADIASQAEKLNYDVNSFINSIKA